MNRPIVILVHTQLPENIGAAARAMKNFGLSELRLVAPREAFPHKRAYDLGGHAADILDNARVYPTVSDAVADCERLYASTARSREMVKPVYTPAEACGLMYEENLKTGILFGPERTGLVNEDVTLCDGIITIPTAAFASLNIAQSVVVITYEWFQAFGRPDEQADRVLPAKSAFADKKELQGFFAHLERRLDAVDFWKVAEKKPKMLVNLHNIFSRIRLTEQEVRTLHGMIAALGEEPKKRD